MIVLIDDDPGMRVSMQFLLEACGYDVASYADPCGLLADLGAETPSCAIIDIHLARGDGLDACRSLRDRRPDLPTIFVTGRVDQRIRAGAAELGAVALLEKPFADEALLEAVRLGLDAAGGAAAEAAIPRIC